MRPKGKLFALVVMFAAVGLLTATGAFTTVQADRVADISTADDSNAVIAIQAADENGEYVDQSSGEAEFRFSNANSANGVNLNASTQINRSINITNNGANSVDLWIEATGDNAGLVSFHNASKQNITGESNSMTLSDGSNATVSVVINTRGESLSGSEELVDSITIHAEAQNSA